MNSWRRPGCKTQTRWRVLKLRVLGSIEPKHIVEPVGKLTSLRVVLVFRHLPRIVHLKLSMVIPVRNEQQSLPLLVAELLDVAQREQIGMVVICVDDGSTDGTWEVIRHLSDRHIQVCGIRLRGNFGKSAALCAGFAAARSPLVGMMDGDLQDNPADIPRFVSRLDQGFDVVNGWKRIRRDAWRRVLASRIFNAVVRAVTGVPLHDHNCGFKLMRREVLDAVPLYGDRHRFIPVLAAGFGFRVTEVEVNHRPRSYGRSKYGMGRIPKGLLDLLSVKFLTSYRQRPQHLLGGLGLVSVGLGLLTWLALCGWWTWAHGQGADPNTPGILLATMLVGTFLLLLGLQLLVAGLLAELIVASKFDSRQANAAAIAESVGFEWDAPRTGGTTAVETYGEEKTIDARTP